MALQDNYHTTASATITVPRPALFLRAALAYAKIGWPVFPVWPDGVPGRRPKTPMHKSTWKRRGTRWAASTDPEFLRRVFEEWHPGAYVGVATGLDARDPKIEWMSSRPVQSSHVFFIDVDTKASHDHDGGPKLDALIARHGPLPDTLTSVGLDGGRHIAFQCPPDRKVITRPLVDERGVKLDGLDVKGEGGYVVAPPSRGRKWIDWKMPVAIAPDWLLDMVCEQPELTVRKSHAPRVARTETRSRDRWSWRESDVPPPRQSAASPMPSEELLAMMREDSALGLSLDPRDYEHLMNTPVERLRCALAVIPNAGSDYDEWVKMGASIYNLVGDAGFPLFDEWSRKSPAYDAAFTEFKWFQSGGISAMPQLDPGAKIFFHANEHDKRRTWELRWLVGLEKRLYRELGL